MTDVQTFHFSPEHDGSVPLETAVFQALGAASVCWDPWDGKGVFMSERAKEIGDALVAYVREMYPHPSGDFTVIGPECFTDGEVICWRGENFVRQSPS